MAIFVGTVDEFKRHIGPRLRNLVNMITKKYKADIGKCEHCGNTNLLEAAHVEGKERNEIIERLLAGHSQDNRVTVDLKDFEERFKHEHDPISNAILILCRECHSQYDKPKPSVLEPVLPSSSRAIPSASGHHALPIYLEPPDRAEFKRAIILRKQATIEIEYSDGRTETKNWDASQITRSSNILGNLRSRPEFRNGNWQARGITSVYVRVARKEP